MKNKPYIFIDIDGVIAIKYKIHWDIVVRINQFIREVDGIAICSSDWRKYESDYKYAKTFIPYQDKTSVKENREEEIKEYIITHNIKNYVIIDDMDCIGDSEMVKHFVRTNEKIGFTRKEHKKAYDIVTAMVE